MNPDGLTPAQRRELAEYFECLLDEHSIKESTEAVQMLWPLVLDDQSYVPEPPPSDWDQLVI